MNLERALSTLEGKELDAILAYWSPDRHAWPVSEADRRSLLRNCLLDRKLAAERVAQLPSRLRDVLVFVIKSGIWSNPIDFKKIDEADLPVDPYELTPVGNALVERGFFVSTRVRGQRATVFNVPDEIGRALEEVFECARRPVDAALSLKAFLRFFDRFALKCRLLDMERPELEDEPRSVVRENLCRPDDVSERLERLEPELRECVTAMREHGGILDDGARRRLGFDVDGDTLERWGRQLEEQLLGTFEKCELTNHGLSCSSGWLIVFHEIVEARLSDWLVDEDEADGDLQRGADPQADLRSIVAELESSPFRVKKSGEYYKSGLKKLQKALTPGFRVRGAEDDLQFHLRYLRRAEAVSVGVDSLLRATRKWNEWERKDSLGRAEDLLRFAMAMRVDDTSLLHQRALREELLKELRTGGNGRWLPIGLPVLTARNRYLRLAVRPEHSHRYQDRHKHAPFPTLATPDAMRRGLVQWVVDGLSRVGLVELAVRRGEKRPWAMRLTRTGAAVLGLEPEPGTARGAGALVVNPDHEIILFPDDAAPELISEVGRFATRLKADYALHYVITRESVQSAAAAGADAEGILSLLRENARHDIPGNVEFSIREWCGKVMSIESRRSYLFETADEASMDRLLEIAEIQGLIRRRLSDRVVELNEDPTQAGIVGLLRDRGIYIQTTNPQLSAATS